MLDGGAGGFHWTHVLEVHVLTCAPLTLTEEPTGPVGHHRVAVTFFDHHRDSKVMGVSLNTITF